MKPYDYLIVGSGLFGAVFAHEAHKAGKRCLVIEKRPHTGGNIYCEEVDGINVHKYGAHIFHTDNREVWNYVNRLVEFNRYTNSPIANYKGKLYNLPFNMNTFYQLWGVRTPAEARAKIQEQCREYEHITHPQNLEEQALKLCGEDIYRQLIKGYTEKQWGRPATELPAFIIRRIPFRFIFDNNYFNDPYQGILTDIEDFQGNAVVNYTDRETPYTRVIEHKHFEFGKQRSTVITYEYPDDFEQGKEPYYPVNDEKNSLIFRKYQELAQQQERVLFGGRLAQYTYADMDDTVAAALRLWEKESL